MGVLGQARARLCALLAAPALLTLVSSTALAQGGTITGRVAAQGSGEVLPESRVIVIGTSIFTSTGADGRYTLRNVPAGTYDLRVLRVGYTEQKKPVTIATGQTLTVDFDMAQAIIKLAEVVTTATGEQRRVELGNSVTSVDVTQRTASAPVTDMASLLVAQSPGVQVMPGNATGVGARIRIRGVNSISLVNDPIYVIDGVRMRSDNGSISGNIFTGGAAQSRAQDINPSEIESIEIVKGPSAATLYGTDASNGVIVITTKRGRAGATRYSVFGESGLITDQNTWPTAYTLWGHAPAGSTRNCRNTSLTQVSSGLCLADSLSKFNLFENSRTTPLGTGNRQNAGLQVSGGVQQLRFFVSPRQPRRRAQPQARRAVFFGLHHAGQPAPAERQQCVRAPLQRLWWSGLRDGTHQHPRLRPARLPGQHPGRVVPDGGHAVHQPIPRLDKRELPPGELALDARRRRCGLHRAH